MYTQFFSLKQSPFSIAPDPRYLYMSERHREALAHLLYGVGCGGGFVLLTGEIGAGKTTVCRCFMEQIPAHCELAYIFNPRLTVEELLLSVCGEFGIEVRPQAGGSASVRDCVDALNRHLLHSHGQGRNSVLIIDEAQNLSADVLEQLRLLTNLETSERKLLQIILIGQPELRAMLARPALEQLAQRVIARYHLGPLSLQETGSYVTHRLAVAGAGGAPLFPGALMRQVHELTGGVPRRINLLCDRALLGAYVENARQVTRPVLRRAAAEVFAQQARRPRPWKQVAAGILAGAAISGAAVWRLLPGTAVQPVSAPAPVPVAAAAAPAAAGTAGIALRGLAALWNQSLPEDGGCAAAARQNLRCLHGKGGLAELRQLDRPAVLKLSDDPAGPRYAVLTVLDERSAAIELDGKRQTLSLEALETRFGGDFITFWRAPRAWRDAVSAGERGPDADWLARRLAQWRGLPAPRENQPLDGAVLRAFQLSQNLKADGMAGPRTFIRLSQLGGVAEPRLLQQPDAGKAGK